MKRHLKRWLVGIGFAYAMLTQSATVLADEPWWWWSHASAYGSESVYDGGWWDAEQGKYGGYYGHMTSWGWNCALPEHRKEGSGYYRWSVMTERSYGVASRDPWLLGTWVEMRLMQPDGTYGQWQILPVIDAGPYGPGGIGSPGWNWDIMEPVVIRSGWNGVAPSRYESTAGPFYGRRDVMVRYRPDLGRYCPAWGYHDDKPQG